MTRVAYLTASCLVAGAERSADAPEHAMEFAVLESACRSIDVELAEVVWDDTRCRIEDYDAFVVGSTWDYQLQPDAFLARLTEIARCRPLWNPLEILRWNLDKRYLAELAARGAPVVPTRFAERADAASITAAFDAFDCDRLVVKPVVGGGAWRQVLLARGDALPDPTLLPPAGALLQPFLEAVVDDGEFSFLFFADEYSHCARKRPARGDYRVQAIHGGRECVHEASDSERAASRRVLEAIDSPLLYARVDMIRLDDGSLALMELELIEPYFYPEQGPETGSNFARALDRLLER